VIAGEYMINPAVYPNENLRWSKVALRVFNLTSFNLSGISSTMSPPKRAFFSLNVDSNADHIYERIEHHGKDGKDTVKVKEHREPLAGSTSLQVLTQPFEKEVKRSVERIVDGRVVRDTETYSSDKPDSHTVKLENKRKKSLWEKYDTSDL
jgi:hypothetical protein